MAGTKKTKTKAELESALAAAVDRYAELLEELAQVKTLQTLFDDDKDTADRGQQRAELTRRAHTLLLRLWRTPYSCAFGAHLTPIRSISCSEISSVPSLILSPHEIVR